MFEAFFAVFQRLNYLTFVVIFLWGFYIMVTRYNLVKKLIGMYLVQTSVIYFLVSISAKKGATVPVLLSTTEPIQAASYANPLPHVLTLTAIVVGVATTGVGLALCAAIYRKYGSLDEQKILERMEDVETSTNEEFLKD
jgi:multicomponent Na+:H+ antiporter subunit C